MMPVFGPVPSRRLGRSIGINNIPPKNCTYSCVYCQVGRTDSMSMTRRAFHEPAEILAAVEEKLRQAEAADAKVDYLTVVPDGEPTLDINLGRLLKDLGKPGIPVAVISNSSLVWDRNVREALFNADWVSLKVDSILEETWRAIDRPHGELGLDRILDGILEFSAEFPGELVTETMIVKGINDSIEEMNELGAFLERVGPKVVYISAPTRPPAEKWVRVPSASDLTMAFHILGEHAAKVEYLISYEGEDFTVTDDAASDLLGILAVHPMRERAVLRFLSGVEDPKGVLGRMLYGGLVQRSEYRGNIYFTRRFPAGGA